MLYPTLVTQILEWQKEDVDGQITFLQRGHNRPVG